MDIKAYIESGVLELYVAGLLSEKENMEVARYAREYPEIQDEILAIESAILSLSEETVPKFVPAFENLRYKMGLGNERAPIPIQRARRNRSAYLGWAASFFLAVGTTYLYIQNREMRSELQLVGTELLQMEQQIADAETSREKSEQLLNSIRDKNVTVVPLGGQTVAPESYAKAYWNKEKSQLFIDAKGLPEPPEGMAYQVWSLKLDPLTPTSVGLLEDFANDENRIFVLNNPNESQAFGITLEPAGGSESPNLEQLYVLGSVAS